MIIMFSGVNISVHGKARNIIKFIYSTASYFTAPRLRHRKINFTLVRGKISVFSRGYFESFSKYKFPSERPKMLRRLTQTVSKYNFTVNDRLKISIPTASYLNISKINSRSFKKMPENFKSLYAHFMKSPGKSDEYKCNHMFHENEERKKSSKSFDDLSATPFTEDITGKKSSKSFDDSSAMPFTEDITDKKSSKSFDDLSALPFTEDITGKTSAESFDDSSAMNFAEALAGRIAFSAVLEGSSSMIATLCKENKKKSDIRMILRKILQQTPKRLSIGVKDGMIYGISAETMRAIFNKMLEDESYANLIANTTGSLTLVIVKYLTICNEFENGNLSKIEMNRRIIKLLTLSGLKLSIIMTVNPSIVPMIAICLILMVGDRLYGDEVMNSVFKQYAHYMNNCDRKIVDEFIADLRKKM